MTAYKEEIFGPVMCIVKVKDIKEGILVLIKKELIL
tara:strand:- start:413 stop:520 length:108 start_codon:yes stop_codon:yes gene_type:complete